MQEISNHPGKASHLQNHPGKSSKRPGSAGHPGKHLGLFKRIDAGMDITKLPLVQKQILEVSNPEEGNAPIKNTAPNEGKKANKIAQNDETLKKQALEHTTTVGDDISEQIAFNSRLSAINLSVPGV